ncbi:hypothetical protein CO666_03700 [Rhizobium chutanense]|uniref:Uncharacterized protein n=1 Tax=Rhizobium chutanense TaxID=2035448 RepID=A0A2A6JIC8_9HYPH|nr:hypothetical protein CO666_03700 [Rhizobium chutanense]
MPLVVASCQSDDKPALPVVISKTVPVSLPPEARKEAPKLTAPVDRDRLPDQVLIDWSSDRIARNVGEYRRAACVAAVDAHNAGAR